MIGDNKKMTNYVQTNQLGYITGIVQEEILTGLFGGTKTMRVSDEEAEAIGTLLAAQHRIGEGLHISALEKLREPKKAGAR